MDAMFNAFHYQSIDRILPYTTKYDSVSWWKCNVIFNGEAVINSRIRAENLQHRGYLDGRRHPP